LRALRSLAKSLAAVPGRKILIFLSAGFGITADITPDLTAAIDACNKANVAVYPIDVRGLVAPTKGALSPNTSPAPLSSEPDQVKLASLVYNGSSHGIVLPAAFFQAGGKPGGTAPRPPASGTGTRPPTTTTRPPVYQNPMNRPRIIPPFPESTTTNQQLFYALAAGTGGFVITNTNDLLSGMQKIAAEQNQYYVLGYSPADSSEGSCHTLKVKVDRSDTIVRARTGYCNVQPLDMLAGTAKSKNLEARANSAESGKFQTSILAPFFYTAPNVARVDVMMEIPSGAMKIEKEKGKYHASVDLLGIAASKDGQIAARFSDTVKLDFDSKDELEAFTKHPYAYEKRFEVPSGSFHLKVVFSSGGESFGKVDTPLVIDPNNGKQFAVSGIALSNTLVNLKDDPAEAEDALLEDRTPLIVNHMQIIPSASNRFKKTDMAVLYVEVYEPLLKTDKPPAVAVRYRVLESKSGALKLDSGLMNVAPSIHPGDPVIPVGLKLVTDKLQPGDYRLEVQAKDSAGGTSSVRTADFQVE
jgi:VWFA-related protein